jgi:hypothetical protein
MGRPLPTADVGYPAGQLGVGRPAVKSLTLLSAAGPQWRPALRHQCRQCSVYGRWLGKGEVTLTIAKRSSGMATILAWMAPI